MELVTSWRSWRGARDIGCARLRARKEANAKWSDNAKRRDNMSLCAVQRDGVLRVDYYHWISTRSGWALRTYVGRDGLIKYQVSGNCRDTPLDLDALLGSGAATIILQDCEVRMHKPKDYRLPVPETASALKSMWDRALSPEVGACCFFCENVKGVDEEGVWVCALCSTPMHHSCAKVMVAECGACVALPPPCDDGVIPTWWLPRVCEICRATQMQAPP